MPSNTIIPVSIRCHFSELFILRTLLQSANQTQLVEQHRSFSIVDSCNPSYTRKGFRLSEKHLALMSINKWGVEQQRGGGGGGDEGISERFLKTRGGVWCCRLKVIIICSDRFLAELRMFSWNQRCSRSTNNFPGLSTHCSLN